MVLTSPSPTMFDQLRECVWVLRPDALLTPTLSSTHSRYSSTPHPAGWLRFRSKKSIPRFEKDVLVYFNYIAFWAVSTKSAYLANCDRHPFLHASLNASSPLPQAPFHNIPDLSVVNQVNIDSFSSQKNLSKREVILGDFLERNLACVK